MPKKEKRWFQDQTTGALVLMERLRDDRKHTIWREIERVKSRLDRKDQESAA